MDKLSNDSNVSSTVAYIPSWLTDVTADQTSSEVQSQSKCSRINKQVRNALVLWDDVRCCELCWDVVRCCIPFEMLWIVLKCCENLGDVLDDVRCKLLWDVVRCCEMLWIVLGCYESEWDVLSCELFWDIVGYCELFYNFIFTIFL